MKIENTPDNEKEHPRSIASIRRANVSEGRNEESVSSTREIHPTSIGSLSPLSSSTSEIHMTCSWRAILGQEVVRGEHHLRGIPIAPKSFFKGCPIAAKVAYPSKVEHDFSQKPVTGVPFTLKLKNRMLETLVKFTWTWESKTLSSLELIGTCEQMLELAPNQETEISLEVLVTEAGVYNLQNLRIIVHRGSDGNAETDKTFQLPQQWLIHVVDTSTGATTSEK